MDSNPTTAQITTRRAMHGVAELLLAGPQHRASGEIALRVTPIGIRTIAEPRVQTDGGYLVTDAARIALNGHTYAAIGAAAGLDVGAPTGLYSDGSGADPDEEIVLDLSALSALVDVFAAGDRALRTFAPETEPVLWPEHFDVAVEIDAVTYGVSPGDDYLPEPYAYVAPPRVDSGGFWNAPFGAARPVREFADSEGIVEFFRTGRDTLSL